VSHCKLPCLAIALTLRHDRQAEHCRKSASLSADGVSGVVAFVCGLLLDSDTNVRNWFSLCIRNGLKVGHLLLQLHVFAEYAVITHECWQLSQSRRQTDRHPCNGLPGQLWLAETRKVKPIWILVKQEMMGRHWHHLDYMQIIYTLFQTDNHASTSSVNFFLAGCSF